MVAQASLAIDGTSNTIGGDDNMDVDAAPGIMRQGGARAKTLIVWMGKDAQKDLPVHQNYLQFLLPAPK